jgi:GGDEF domain-containing protein
MHEMSQMFVLSPFNTGAFEGIAVLILILSLVVGYAYGERMLGWHAATLASGLSGQALAASNPNVAFILCAAQLGLAVQALCKTLGTAGAMRKPAFVLRVFAALAIPAVLLLFEFDELSGQTVGVLLLPWFAITLWYLFRARAGRQPWLGWLALGQLALLIQWLMGLPELRAYLKLDPTVGALAALAGFASATYIGMVCKSRFSSENALRVSARESTDPLTGLAMPIVFFDRVDGAIIRSRHLRYACALMLIRVENMDQLMADNKFDSLDRVALAASKAIADALRSQDSAARLSGNRFGVMAEGLDDNTANKIATKILANGLRASEWGLTRSELQFQIVMVELDSSEVKSAEVLVALEDALRSMTYQASASRIRTLPRITGYPAPPSRY